MAHDHSHGDRNAYYLDQLFTIAVCGALGGVAVMLWYSGKLGLMLAPKFFIWVLLGGITLLTLVLIRALAVWRSVDAPEHTHDHEHCGHDHGHCDHDHGIQTKPQTTGVASSRRVGSRSIRVALSAGARPNAMPVTSASAIVNARTRRSIERSTLTGS